MSDTREELALDEFYQKHYEQCCTCKYMRTATMPTYRIKYCDCEGGCNEGMEISDYDSCDFYQCRYRGVL